MARRAVDRIAAHLADVLAPRRCAFCGAAGGEGPACPACTAALPWNDTACRACAQPLNSGSVCAACLRDSPPQDATWAAFRYETPVIQQIVALKFRAAFPAARTLGALIAARIAARGTPLPDVLVPVPLHASRLRQRGYNQTLELARELAPRLSLALAPGAARRIRATREQTELHAEDRRRNVRGVFEADPAIAGRTVALLDDVITTGATVAELARALRKAGARRVEAWAVARAA